MDQIQGEDVRLIRSEGSADVDLGCTYVSSRTLPRFFSVFLYSTLSFPLHFPGKPSIFPGSEPSLGLVWAQNKPNRQNTPVFCGHT